LEIALRPKRADVAIPALAVTVFNPDTEAFSEVTTQPITLTVSAASRLGAGDLVGSLAGSGTPEIRSQAQGIFQNVTDLSELSDQRVNVVVLAEVTAGLWCAVGCMIAVVTSHRRNSGDVAGQKRRRAARAAGRGLAEARPALAEGRSMDAFRAIRAALIGLIADRRNRVEEGLPVAEAAGVLVQTLVPAAERAAV